MPKKTTQKAAHLGVHPVNRTMKYYKIFYRTTLSFRVVFLFYFKNNCRAALDWPCAFREEESAFPSKSARYIRLLGNIARDIPSV